MGARIGRFIHLILLYDYSNESALKYPLPRLWKKSETKSSPHFRLNLVRTCKICSIQRLLQTNDKGQISRRLPALLNPEAAQRLALMLVSEPRHRNQVFNSTSKVHL